VSNELMPGGSWVEGRLWVIDSNGEKSLYRFHKRTHMSMTLTHGLIQWLLNTQE
jgi:hypothetical protein